ncbi:OmpA family protein [Flavobacterium paronense]|uniref:OmpA family protein n=1 Tax=Flavobacterium paronense TaxID=1392775 RepID=A0ABV5GI09_9FLAO|nr:OmpA family protein [Flavobacterium paronense]MDN3677131.1 OmpA family protein [Flavobacterium paronense]
MKNYLLLLIPVFFITLSSNAQKDNKKNKKDLELITVNPDKELVGEYFNRWSIEAEFGQAKGSKPYADGYYANNPGKFFGGLAINHFGIGARYMFSPKFGVKSNLNVDNLQEQNNSGSLPFQMRHIQLSGEGVTNLTRLFDIQNQAGRFGLLFHFGFQVSRMTPLITTSVGYSNKGKSEWNGGIVAGLAPQFRIFKNVSLFADVTINSNVRQHFNWDGSDSDSKNNLTGSLFRTSLGISVALGKGKIHGDWAIIQDKNDKRLDSLNNKIGEIEELMNDSDKDGVPDYLDAEQNSIAGVAVDTKGRMVDKNSNGVPDELEKYVNNTISNNNTATTAAATEGAVLQLINDGYIAAYFDTGKSMPNAASASNIGFILNFLKNNPNKSVDITGYADEIGRTDYNQKLASDRAQAVKTILAKAGIAESRLNILSNGEDDSVDKKSDWARRLVRKTIFKVK